MPQRRNKKPKRRPSKKKSVKKGAKNAPKTGSGGGGIPDSILEQLTGDLGSLTQPDPSLRGPRDDQRTCPKWTDEQIERFVVRGEFSDTDDDDDDADDAATDARDVDLKYALQPMPEPREMADVYGTKGGGGAGGVGDQTALLTKMLNPDAGGEGFNTDGVTGLFAQDLPSDPRERLRKRIKDMRRRRTKWGEDDFVRDARGRKIPGARQMTMDDLNGGGRMARNVQIDKTKSAAHRKAMIEKMRAELAERKAARAKARAKAEQVASENDGATK